MTPIHLHGLDYDKNSLYRKEISACMKEGGRRRRERREKWRRGSEGDEKKEGRREGKERKDT